MNWAKNITNIPRGSYSSITGYAAEQAFLARAEKAGFNLFFKVWRDLEYDAVLDAHGTLFRVEVKGSSDNVFSFTRGRRSGIQIKRDINKTRIISRNDCDFVVGVNVNDFTCHIIPTEIIEIFQRENLSAKALNFCKENWNFFIGGRLTTAHNFKMEMIRHGFIDLEDDLLDEFLLHLGQLHTLPLFYSPLGTRGLRITDQHKIRVLKIWENL